MDENEIKREGWRKKIARLFSSGEFRFLLFIVAVLIVSGPFLIPSEHRPVYFPFIYYFSAWCGIWGVTVVVTVFGEKEDDTQ